MPAQINPVPYPLVSAGTPQLTLSIGANSSQTTYASITEGATPDGGSGIYTYAWTLQRDNSTDGTSLLSDSTIQASAWTPDRAGWWDVRCTVNSGDVTVTASRRLRIIIHTQTIDVPLSTLVMAPL